MKIKAIKKQLAEIMTPVIENLYKYGTPEFQPIFVFTVNDVEYKVEHEIKTNGIVITLYDYYGCYPRALLEFTRLNKVKAHVLAKAFADENMHLVSYAKDILKKRH